MADRYASLKQGLVGCWIPSVSGSGLLLPDLSGRGNNGSLINTSDTVWASTIGGRAIQFDGVNDYVETSQNVGLTQQATVCCWLMLKSVTSAGILAELTTNYNNANGLILTQDTFGFTVYLSNPGQYNGTEYTVSIETDKPTHVCAIYDRSLGAAASATRLFLNGRSLTGTQSLSFTITGNFAAAKMFFGARSGGVAPSNSAMLDCRVYNRILTESEIRLLASEPGIGFKPAKKLSRFSQRFTYKPDKPRNYSVIRNRDPNYSTLRHGLVAAYCPSISGQGNVLPDLVGGNHGTLTNMDASDWVSSGDGRALDFDGSDDWVNLGDVLGFAGSNQTISISWWAYLKTANDVMIPFNKCRNSSTNSGWEVASYASGGVYYVYWFSANGVFPNRTFVQAIASGTALQWRHYAITFQAALGASAGIKIYENTTLLTNQVGESGSTAIAANALSAKISARDSTASPGTPIEFTPAVLDDIRIYSRALTESEIKLLASKRGIGLEPRKPKITFTDLGVQKTYSVVRVKETDYATLRQGLVGAWCPSLPNGGGGNTLPDVSGYSNHGVLTNMSPDDWVSGQYGRALDFDGSNDTVDTNQSGLFNFTSTTSQFTITLFGLDRSGNRYSNAIAKNSGGSSTDGGYYLSLSQDSTGLDGAKAHFAVYMGINVFTGVDFSFPENEWRHVAIVVNMELSGTARVEAYINGVNTGTKFSQGVGTAITTNTRTVRIGSDSAGNFVHDGQLDDIRVYSRILTEPEIKLLASRPGIGLRQESHQQTFYQFPSGSRRRQILTGMP